MKPGPEWTIPLCVFHHQEGHQIGWRTFEARYQVELRSVAMAMTAASPVLRKRKEVHEGHHMFSLGDESNPGTEVPEVPIAIREWAVSNQAG